MWYELGTKNLWIPWLLQLTGPLSRKAEACKPWSFCQIFFSKTTWETQHMGQQFWLLGRKISLNKSCPRDCFSICTHTFCSTSLLVATKDQCIIYPTTFLFSSNWYCKNALQFQKNSKQLQFNSQSGKWPINLCADDKQVWCLEFCITDLPFVDLNNSEQRFSATLTVTLLCYSWQMKLVSPVMKLLFPS